MQIQLEQARLVSKLVRPAHPHRIHSSATPFFVVVLQIPRRTSPRHHVGVGIQVTTHSCREFNSTTSAGPTRGLN
jgi:hypothetical protein